MNLATPAQAVAWSCHAATTIKDAKGNVLAECGGNGRYSEEDELIAAEIAKRINCFQDLLNALTFCEIVIRGDLTTQRDGALKTASAAIARATKTTTEWTETSQAPDGRTT